MIKPAKEKLSITDAKELQRQLYWKLSNNEDVAINFEDVSYVDLAIIQLLVAAKKEAIASDKIIVIQNVNKELHECFELCGVETMLKV